MCIFDLIEKYLSKHAWQLERWSRTIYHLLCVARERVPLTRLSLATGSAAWEAPLVGDDWAQKQDEFGPSRVTPTWTGWLDQIEPNFVIASYLKNIACSCPTPDNHYFLSITYKLFLWLNKSNGKLEVFCKINKTDNVNRQRKYLQRIFVTRAI